MEKKTNIITVLVSGAGLLFGVIYLLCALFRISNAVYSLCYIFSSGIIFGICRLIYSWLRLIAPAVFGFYLFIFGLKRQRGKNSVLLMNSVFVTGIGQVILPIIGSLVYSVGKFANSGVFIINSSAFISNAFYTVIVILILSALLYFDGDHVKLSFSKEAIAGAKASAKKVFWDIISDIRAFLGKEIKESDSEAAKDVREYSEESDVHEYKETEEEQTWPEQ